MSAQDGRYSHRPTGGHPSALAGVENGRIPLSNLGRCATQAHLETPYLYAPAARAFDAMVRAAAKDGVSIQAVALYRDFDGQVRMKRIWTARGKPQNAATPGTSNHGWGTAADLNARGPGVLAWLVKHGPAFGWDHPMWAGSASGPAGGPEPWHWQFIQGFTLADEVPVSVRGVAVDADAYLEAGRVHVALRPVAEALDAEITGFDDGRAHVQGATVGGWVPMETRNGRGFVLAKDLAAALGVTVAFADGRLTIT